MPITDDLFGQRSCAIYTALGVFDLDPPGLQTPALSKWRKLLATNCCKKHSKGLQPLDSNSPIPLPNSEVTSSAADFILGLKAVVIRDYSPSISTEYTANGSANPDCPN